MISTLDSGAFTANGYNSTPKTPVRRTVHPVRGDRDETGGRDPEQFRIREIDEVPP